MALVLVVDKSTISADCATLTITDQTGNYDASTNTGGYGAPNETRANLYLKLFVTLKKTTGDEPQTVPAYNENTASEWEITISEDGRYEAVLFGCLVWSAAITYALNEITYDAAQDEFYKSVQAGNINQARTDTAWWTPVTTPAELQAAADLPQADVYIDTDDIVELCNSKICRAEAYRDADCGCVDDPCNLSTYEKIRLKIEGAEIEDAAGNPGNAQVIIENLQEVCVNRSCQD